MGKWESLKFDLGPIPQLAEAIQALADAIVTVATIIKTATEIVAALVTDLLNVEAMLIKAALQAIEDILNQFLQGTVALHLLVVPPRKILPYIDESATDWTAYENPYTAISQPLMEDSRDFYTKLNAVFNVLGGNPAYGRTVLESIADEADFNRPQYGASDAYFSVAILAGSTSILELIGYITALMSVFKGTARTMMPPMIARPPQDLKASTISAPKSGRVAVRLTWTNPPTEQEIRVFDDAKPLITRIEEIAVVRTTDPTLITAKLWGDLLPGYQPSALKEGETERQNVKTIETSKGKVELIRLFKFDGVQESYVDDDAKLEKGVSYHYAAAYRYSLAMPDLDGKVTKESHIPQNYSAISNVVKALVDKEKYVTHRAGVPPDWDMTPNLLDLIPDLKFFLALIKNYVEAMKSQVAGAQSALNSYIAFLQSEIDRYTAYAKAVADKIRSLSELMRLPQAGIYVTILDGAVGGTQAFIGELMDRLTDETDSTAPPYFRHGVTAGLVLYAGAPNPAALASVKALISLLLGLNTGQNPLELAVDSIDNIISAVEQQPGFSSNLLPSSTAEITAENQAKIDADVAAGLTGGADAATARADGTIDPLTGEIGTTGGTGTSTVDGADPHARLGTGLDQQVDAGTQVDAKITFDDAMLPVGADSPDSNVPFDP